MDCVAQTAHFVIGYGSASVAPTDTSRPAKIQQLLDDLNSARSTYAGLGFKVPEKTYVLLDTPIVGAGVGFSPPPLSDIVNPLGLGPKFSTIWMDLAADEDKRTGWLPAHEYFHQVVFSYIGANDMRLHPLDNWFWNEALSNWGAHEALLDMSSSRTSDAYASFLPDFLSDPSMTLDWNLGPVPDGREYGGFILAEHLQERFGDGAVVDFLETADQFGVVNLSGILADVLDNKGSSFSTEIAHFWQSAYVMKRQYGIGFMDGAADAVWRPLLKAAESLTPGGRAGHDTAEFQGAETFTSGSVSIGAGGAKFIELEKPFYGGDATWTVTANSGDVRAFVISMADVEELDVCMPPEEIELAGPVPTGEYGLPIASGCPTSTLMIVNTATPGGDSAAVDWIINLKPRNATVGTSLVEIGFTDMGNLIDDPIGQSDAESRPALGLRMKGDPETEVLGWGCACEGWGVGTPDDPSRSGGVSWSNGTSNAVVDTFRRESSTSVTSEVRIADEYLVKHHFHPSSSPNLIQIDVEVLYVGEGPTPTDVYYRRVFDWDIPDDVFTEYATMATSGDTSFVAHTSDDGFNEPDPSSPRTEIDASGYFEDSGPRDNGGQIELSLGSFETTNYKEFTLFYGAARSEGEALAALGSVPAQVYSLGQHDPTTGGPVTAIFAVDGSSLSSAASRRLRDDRLQTSAAAAVVTVNRDRAQQARGRGAER